MVFENDVYFEEKRISFLKKYRLVDLLGVCTCLILSFVILSNIPFYKIQL